VRPFDLHVLLDDDADIAVVIAGHAACGRAAVKRTALLACAVALALTGCPRTRGTTEPTPRRSLRPPTVSIVAQNVRLTIDAARAVRFGFVAAEPTIRIIVTYPDTGAIVAACALERFDSPAQDPNRPQCKRELPSGVREELSAPAVGAVAIWVRSGNPVTANVRVEYAEGARPRVVRLGFPLLPAPANPSACKDNACNPLVEITPVRGGNFTADATWIGGVARLALLQGRLLAKSFSATGVPYAVPAEDRDGARTSIRARLSSPAEYGLVVDENRTDITDVVITTRWP
jgi:hypothetical protein